jgi:5-methylcytosine-specific restriction endonuclease McrA
VGGGVVTFPAHDYIERQRRATMPSKRPSKYKPGRLTLAGFLVRAEMYGRKKGRVCSYCLRIQSVTLDHVVPKSTGGRNLFNLVPACVRCNGSKGARSLLGFAFGWLE